MVWFGFGVICVVFCWMFAAQGCQMAAGHLKLLVGFKSEFVQVSLAEND